MSSSLKSSSNSINDAKETINAADLTKLKTHYHAFVFNILGLTSEESDSSNDDLPNSLMDLIINLRNQSKENKDWSTADLIRDELKKLNISIKDTKESSTWDYEK